MKTICITGAPGNHLDKVANILRQAGMKSPKSHHRSDALSLNEWHAQVLDGAIESSTSEWTIQHPGKLWEQLASAIYLPNLSTPLWGWADARSVWLLDFWMAFDPKLHFVFVTISSLDALAGQLANGCGENGQGLASFPAIWENHHQQLLRFHHRHPRRTMLVDAAQCLTHPEALIATCAERWAINFSGAEIIAPVNPVIDPLARYLAQQILLRQPQLQSLQNELDANVLQFQATESLPGDVLDLRAALHTYLQHCTSITTLAKAADQAHAENLDLTGEVNALVILEQTLLENNVELTAGLEAMTQQKAAAQKSLELAGKKLAEAESAHSASRTKAEALTQQLKEGEAKSKAMQIEAARDAQKALELTQKLATAESTLKEVELENELVLAQLHQVQEALERHFILSQEAEKNSQKEQTRRQRMLKRMPAYMDFTLIEILSLSEQEGAQEVSWHFAGLDAAGREIPELLFKTRTRQSELSFIFAPAPGSNAMSLLRWPSCHDTEKDLVLTTGSRGATSVQQIEILLNLSTSDYNLLKALCRLLIGALAIPDEIKAPAELDIKGLTGALQSFLKTLEKQLVAFRFDRVSLKHEQIDPDYEHLWFEFTNISFSDKHWSKFECRLSCSNVQSNQFGGFPKLEFPESSVTPLETWRAAQHDAFGPKLEFNFALPNALDMGVWTQFSAQDQRFIASLILQLPEILGILQQSDVTIKRPWMDWMELAASMRTIMAKQIFAVRNSLYGPNIAMPTPIASEVAVSSPVDLKQAKSKRLTAVPNGPRQKERRTAGVK